jgi:hypothetical protein
MYGILALANKNLCLDAGVYIGVTRSADDWHP